MKYCKKTNEILKAYNASKANARIRGAGRKPTVAKNEEEAERLIKEARGGASFKTCPESRSIQKRQHDRRHFL